MSTARLEKLLSDLTGETATLLADRAEDCQFGRTGGVSYSQFNELLLLFGFDRIKRPFFQYLVDGSPDYKEGAVLESLDHLEEGIRRFRTLAALRFGNVKYSFQNLSRWDADELSSELAVLDPIPEDRYKLRPDPLLPLDEIDGDDTYFLGYIIERELKARLDANSNDEVAKESLKKRQQIVARGIKNHEAYLASDYMDVYVATSMRERHEFFMVNAIAKKIFSDEKLSPLHLRWFNPTQAYCFDRLDKGLSEALMLKRAACTLYLAQESDTLGKDSELASTLAQGKAVVAFVPRIDDDGKTVEWMLNAAERLYPNKSRGELILHQLQVFTSEAAWNDKKVRDWLNAPESLDVTEAEAYLNARVSSHYESRARTLKESHPLAIQVALDTGVANGVLVARTTEECAELIYRILTNSLEFELEETLLNGEPYLLLRESMSGSVFRVVTGDALLTNAFWNFYLED